MISRHPNNISISTLKTFHKLNGLRTLLLRFQSVSVVVPDPKLASFRRTKYDEYGLPIVDQSENDKLSESPKVERTAFEKLNRDFLWENEMRRFWESLNFQQFRIDILINLGHGKYVDPQILFSSKTDLAKFASFTLEQTRHLRFGHDVLVRLRLLL